jgi:Protein of unknown function (DUF2868)
MKTNWHYKHLIDLEYFCHQDSAADNHELHLRDRNIFLGRQAEPAFGDDPADRDLLHLWLTSRIADDFPAPERKSPGTIFRDTYLLGKNLAAIAGVIVGLTGGLSFFTYTGTTPVNVFHFLLLFVVSQLALVGFLVTACLLRPLLPGRKVPSFYTMLFRGMLSRLVAFLHKQWLRKIGAGQRSSVNHAFGIFKARNTLYGSLFYWPFFTLAQLFAIGFNVGLLAATLGKIATSDLAFGWQSTMQFTAGAIHRWAMLAASPWSWFVPRATSYPSLAEIEGSRIILKEGIYHLTTANLIAWWPFLVFCLLFYGLILRLLLLAAGKLMERAALRRLQLDTPACLALLRRMRTPLVTSQAAPEPDRSAAGHRKTSTTAPPRSMSTDLSGQVALLPDEIAALCPAERLDSWLQERGLRVDEVHNFMTGYDEDRQLLGLLAARQWRPGQGLFILMEGWMVPLVGFLTFLQELRNVLPPRTIISLGLAGRPQATGFSPVAPEDFVLWQAKVEALGDPYLTVFSLISRQDKQ